MDTGKSIFEYMDYRTFLQDIIKEKKVQNPSYSMRAMALRIQCEPGFFNRILRGVRKAMPAHIVELGKVLRLSKKEQQYFELLVSYNHAKKQVERDHYFEQMQQFRKMNVKQMGNDQYALYSHWYYLVLRELLTIATCRNESEDSYREISKRLSPQISHTEVREAISTLLKLGVITCQDDGTLKPADSFTASGSAVPQVIVNRFLLEFADLARRAVDFVPREQRRFSTLTFTVSKSGFSKVADKIDEFRQELLKIVEDDQEMQERVYHLNLHLFPVSTPSMENK